MLTVLDDHYSLSLSPTRSTCTTLAVASDSVRWHQTFTAMLRLLSWCTVSMKCWASKTFRSGSRISIRAWSPGTRITLPGLLLVTSAIYLSRLSTGRYSASASSSTLQWTFSHQQRLEKTWKHLSKRSSKKCIGNWVASTHRVCHPVLGSRLVKVL